jgi:hypothetical protein
MRAERDHDQRRLAERRHRLAHVDRILWRSRLLLFESSGEISCRPAEASDWTGRAQTAAESEQAPSKAKTSEPDKAPRSASSAAARSPSLIKGGYPGETPQP